MADMHDRGRALAIRMLAPRTKGKGLALTLKKKIMSGEYDPEAGGQGFTWSDSDGSGLRTRYAQKDIDNTYILQSDLRMLISPVKLDGKDMPEPSTNDVILFDGSEYNIINVGPWNYAGVKIGWACQCRGL